MRSLVNRPGTVFSRPNPVRRLKPIPWTEARVSRSRSTLYIQCAFFFAPDARKVVAVDGDVEQATGSGEGLVKASRW